MSTRSKLTAAALAVAGAVTVIGGGGGAGEASASVRSGMYSYVGSGGTVPVRIARSELIFTQEPGSLIPQVTRYRLHQTPRGGYADNAIGQRIVLRAKGNGYVGTAYIAGVKISDIRLVPRR
ncbi:hypothetical protein [Gordonia sputi]|uniref:hypothetical protein n=1 Tax=Gordonia sputi TaxID=36823 RepID=UPI0022700005|nr:hypothetical protein [Gordonia sputi]